MNELVGKGRPFYSAMDMGAKALKRKVGTGAEFLKELMSLPGVKPTELKERGLEHLMNEPKMTHEQFLGQLARKPAPKINEKVLTEGGDEETIQELIEKDAREYANREIGTNPRMRDDWAETYQGYIDHAYEKNYIEYQRKADKLVKQGLAEPAVAHSEYTLPGGENYREMLIKVPKEMEGFKGVRGHFNGEPDILASMRLKDRTGPNGEKLLHLEELQSDWHQQGRDKGYGRKLIDMPKMSADELLNEHDDDLKPEQKKYLKDFMNKWESAEYNGRENDLSNLTDQYQNWVSKQTIGSGVPDAPFKKNWEEMAIKRLIHHAAEHGYHGIVMTPGEEQADRYNLAKYINDVQYDPKVKHLTAQGKKGEAINKIAQPNELPNYVGKELAEKLLQTELSQGRHKLSGLDLEVGGEGMKGFYDKKVPNIFNAVGKKHGVKMNLHGHPLHDIPPLPEDHEPEDVLSHAKMASTPLHHFPITKSLREDVLKNGLPLYNTGGVVHKAEGGNVQPSVEQMRMALQNKGTFPKYGIQLIGANEAPNMSPKYYIEPGNDGHPSVGGVDMNTLTPGMQLVQQDAQAMQPPQGTPIQGTPPQPSGNVSSPLGAPPQGGQSNILNMTPQGQALGAMAPPQQLQPPRMASGGNVQGYASKGYVVHEPLKPHPDVGTRFTATPQGNLVKAKNFDIMKHEGKGSIINSPYDATTRDNLVTEVSGHNLINPLLTEAGFEYSMDPMNVKQKIGGASNLGIAGRQQGRIDIAGNEHDGKVFVLPSTMSDSDQVKDFPENFSHHPAHILLDLMRQRQLSKNTLQMLSDDLRKQHELKKNVRTGITTKTYPYTKFLGFDHPLVEEQLIKGGHGLETTAGNLRKKMVERLGLVNMQKLLDYNIQDLRGSILEPDLATDPKGYMGRVVVEAKPGAPLRLSKHTAYDTDTHGVYRGGFKNRPIELVQPDIFSTVEKEIKEMSKNKGKSPDSIRAQVIGAIEKRKEKIAQPINARVINNAGLYEEGLKQGEFDPKNLQSVLAYFNRKGGYKKGGKVASMDTMRLELSKKTKKA
jgi:hypothetical protein